MPSYAIYIELKVEPENGGAYVHSQQVPGLHLIGRCFSDMKPALERAIVQLWKDNHGENVGVIWLSDVDGSHSLVGNVVETLERAALYQKAA